MNFLVRNILKGYEQQINGQDDGPTSSMQTPASVVTKALEMIQKWQANTGIDSKGSSKTTLNEEEIVPTKINLPDETSKRTKKEMLENEENFIQMDWQQSPSIGSDHLRNSNSTLQNEPSTMVPVKSQQQALPLPPQETITPDNYIKLMTTHKALMASQDQPTHVQNHPNFQTAYQNIQSQNFPPNSLGMNQALQIPMQKSFYPPHQQTLQSHQHSILQPHTYPGIGPQHHHQHLMPTTPHPFFVSPYPYNPQLLSHPAMAVYQQRQQQQQFVAAAAAATMFAAAAGMPPPYDLCQVCHDKVSNFISELKIYKLDTVNEL